MLMLRPNLSAIALRGTVFKEGDEVISVEPSWIGFIPFKGNPRELPGPLLSYCHKGSPEHTYKFPFHHLNLPLNLNLFFYSQLSGKKKNHMSPPHFKMKMSPFTCPYSVLLPFSHHFQNVSHLTSHFTGFAFLLYKINPLPFKTKQKEAPEFKKLYLLLKAESSDSLPSRQNEFPLVFPVIWP